MSKSGFGAYYSKAINIGASIIKQGFGAQYYTIRIIRSPQNCIGNYEGPYVARRNLRATGTCRRVLASSKLPELLNPGHQGYHIGALVTRIGCWG